MTTSAPMAVAAAVKSAARYVALGSNSRTRATALSWAYSTAREDRLMTDNDHTDALPILRLTPEASAMIAELQAEEAEAGPLALYVEVSGSDGDTYTYDLYFQAAADATASDFVDRTGTVTVVVPSASVDSIARFGPRSEPRHGRGWDGHPQPKPSSSRPPEPGDGGPRARSER